MAESATMGCRSDYGFAKLRRIRVCLSTDASTFASDSDSKRTGATRQDP